MRSSAFSRHGLDGDATALDELDPQVVSDEQGCPHEGSGIGRFNLHEPGVAVPDQDPGVDIESVLLAVSQKTVLPAQPRQAEGGDQAW
jgi:hypothetical protein